MTLTLNITMGGALTGAASIGRGHLVRWGPRPRVVLPLYLTAPVVGAVSAAFVHLGLTRLAGGRTIARLAVTPAESAPICEIQ
jgi:hypothetical protein